MGRITNISKYVTGRAATAAAGSHPQARLAERQEAALPNRVPRADRPGPCPQDRCEVPSDSSTKRPAMRDLRRARLDSYARG